MNRVVPFSFMCTLSITLLPACGGLSSSNGEFGNLSYTLGADFIPESGQLTENRIVTGYEQSLMITTLPSARRQFMGLDQVVHRFDPPAGVTISQGTETGDSESVPDFRVTVTDPGSYMVYSELDGQVVDQIELAFAVPTEIELISRRRFPGETEFSDVQVGQKVPFGTHVSVLPIPSDRGERLMGDILVNMRGTPEEAVIQDVSVVSHVEQRVYSKPTNAVYLVGLGEVDVIVEEPVSGAEETLSFVVE